MRMLPKKVTVFSKEFEITYVKHVSEVDKDKEDALYGQVDYRTDKIRIYKPEGSSDGEVWHIVFHEVFHIIKDNMNIDFAQDDEERIIDTLALGMFHFLKENKICFK